MMLFFRVMVDTKYVASALKHMHDTIMVHQLLYICMHDDDAASCMEKSSIDSQHRYFKVLTYKDFVPTFCEIADIWVFTNCQCDV